MFNLTYYVQFHSHKRSILTESDENCVEYVCDVRMLKGSQNYMDESSTVSIVEQKLSIDLTDYLNAFCGKSFNRESKIDWWNVIASILISIVFVFVFVHNAKRMCWVPAYR